MIKTKEELRLEFITKICQLIDKTKILKGFDIKDKEAFDPDNNLIAIVKQPDPYCAPLEIIDIFVWKDSFYKKYGIEWSRNASPDPYYIFRSDTITFTEKHILVLVELNKLMKSYLRKVKSIK